MKSANLSKHVDNNLIIEKSISVKDMDGFREITAVFPYFIHKGKTSLKQYNFFSNTTLIFFIFLLLSD